MQYQKKVVQCQEKVVQCDERVYNIRRATSAVGRQGVWCEEKVLSIRNITSTGVQYQEGDIM